MFGGHTITSSTRARHPTKFTYLVEGRPILPPRRLRQVLDRATARDEAWMSRRPHEPGYLRPPIDGEFWSERLPAGALVFVRRIDPGQMQKVWVEPVPATKARHPGGLWRTVLKDPTTGRLHVLLVDERSPGSPDRGPFDAATELPPDQVAPLIRGDPAALRDYADRLRYTGELYGASPPDWWMPCPACRGDGCRWCDGIGRMHPTRVDWADHLLPAYGPDVALFHHLLDDGSLDTPVQREAHLPPGNLRAMELAAFMSQDSRFDAFTAVPADELRRALELFEEELNLSNLAGWWDPGASQPRSEGQAEGLLYVMHLLGLGT